MKMVNFSLSLVACVMLAACGSSGGSDNQASPNKTVTNNASSTSNNPNNSATNTSSKNSTHTGHASVIGKASVTKVSDPSLSKITVEGKDIQISYPGISSAGWQSMKIGNGNKALFVCCGKYSDTKFGAYEGGENGNAYFFHNGKATQNMPTIGTATYNGHVIIAGKTSHFDDEDYLKGTSQFTANFADKKLLGTLNVNTMKAVTVNANISGNDFNGTASSDDFASPANVVGKFYGDKAKELSGIFDGGKNWGGAFGAAQAK